MGKLSSNIYLPELIFFFLIVYFGTGSAVEPGSNVNWTCRARSGTFSPRFECMAERDPEFSSAFANFGQEPDRTELRHH
jgi:hypothetical protein